MAIDRFPIEASHILMFARSVGDPNPIYDPSQTDAADIVAPPTFAQASAQFDPDYFLRPKLGEAWFGSGKEPTGVKPKESSAAGAAEEAVAAAACTPSSTSPTTATSVPATC